MYLILYLLSFIITFILLIWVKIDIDKEITVKTLVLVSIYSIIPILGLYIVIDVKGDDIVIWRKK